jgi:hypothetical protein
MEEYEFMGDHSEEATASLAMNATISKDDTDISKQKALLSAKRGRCLSTGSGAEVPPWCVKSLSAFI